MKVKFLPGFGFEGEVGEFCRDEVELVGVEGDGGGGFVDVEVDEDMSVKVESGQVRGEGKIVVGWSDVCWEDYASCSCVGVHGMGV